MPIWVKIGSARASETGWPVRNTLSRRSASSSLVGGVEVEGQAVVGAAAPRAGARSRDGGRGAEVLLVAPRAARRRTCASSRSAASSPTATVSRSPRSSLQRRVTLATSSSTGRALGRRRLRARADRDEQLHAGQVQLDDAVVAADDLARPVLADHLGDPAAGLRAEPVGREVDEHADEVAVEVDAGEHADGAVLGAVDDELGQPQQVGGRRLEQLVARQRAQRGQQPAAGVAVGPHARAQQDLGDAPAHDRHAADGAVLGVGDQAEEHVDRLRAGAGGRGDDGDAVVVRRAAHRRHQRRLEDDQRGAAAEGRQQLERRDARARRAARPDAVVVAARRARAGQLVGRVGGVAEDHVVAVGQPAQQLAGLVAGLAVELAGVGGELVGELADQLVHVRGVGDARAARRRGPARGRGRARRRSSAGTRSISMCIHDSTIAPSGTSALSSMS